MATDRKGVDLEDRLIGFSVRIINLVESLPRTKAARHVADQILRSGTSPAPNYGEAQGAESRADFIHKMQVCLKELRETRVWLITIQRSRLIKQTAELEIMINECNELISIFVTSIKTAKRNERDPS